MWIDLIFRTELDARLDRVRDAHEVRAEQVRRYRSPIAIVT